MFLGVNPLRQTVWRVVWLYRHYCLYDQRPAIEFLGHKVHAAAMLAITRIQRALMCMQAFVLGQQRGMDIEQATLIVAYEICTENAHESGQNHQLRFESVNDFDQCSIEGLAALECFVIQYAGIDTCVFGALQAVGICAVEITARILAGLSLMSLLSIKACKLLPVPESSTTTSQVSGISAP